MHEQVCLGHLLQRGMKGCHQDRWQALYKPYSIGQEKFLASRQPYPPRHRVKRGEELILRQAACAACTARSG